MCRLHHGADRLELVALLRYVLDTAIKTNPAPPVSASRNRRFRYAATASAARCGKCERQTTVLRRHPVKGRGTVYLIRLPLHPQLDAAAQDRVIDAIAEVLV
jgi:hypothetical protein